jgi:hypothetical protein
MCDVYGSAAFCIAATAAENSDTGLFVDRDLRFRTPVKVDINWGQVAATRGSVPSGSYALRTEWISTIFNIDDAVLNKRAWV